ncbi:hypothetical protein P5E67_04975 [Vibrio parahaemolyticus]|nr:hypothetical protein [Vibrio parahaemolyticus]
MADNSASVKISELMLDELEKVNANLERIASVNRSETRKMFGSIGMSGLKKALPAIGAGGMLAYTKSVIDAEANMQNLSQILDVSASKLLQLERAGQRFGTSFSSQLMGIKSTFAGLNQEDVSALYGNLAKFGIKDPSALIQQVQGGNALDIFKQIQKEWSGLTSNQQIRVGETLGMDTGMMAILNNPDRFARFMQQINVTEKDVEQAVKAKEALDNFLLNFKDVMTNFVNGFVTGIAPLTDALNEANFKGLGETAKQLGESLGTIITFLAKLIGEETPVAPDVEVPGGVTMPSLFKGEEPKPGFGLGKTVAKSKFYKNVDIENQLWSDLSEQDKIPESASNIDIAVNTAELILSHLRQFLFSDGDANQSTSNSKSKTVQFSPTVIQHISGPAGEHTESWKKDAEDWLEEQKRIADTEDWP